MATDTIQYIQIQGCERVIEALTVPMEMGLADAFLELAVETASVSCAVVERNDLQTILESSSVPVIGIEIHYTSGLSGNALLLVELDRFACLASIFSGIEDIAHDAIAPEALEMCVRYFTRAFQICNKRFMAQQGYAIDSDDSKLINSDGALIGLSALSASYDGVLVLTFRLSSEPRLNCNFKILIQPDLKESLIFLLSDHAPVTPAPGITAQTVVAQKEGTHSMLNNSPIVESKTAAGRTLAQPGSDWNIDLLLDVELPMVVSFGGTELPLKDVLKLGVGSVIELDKSVNDPVTVTVNQKPIAHGEVVLVDGNYGVRILEVESTADRIRSLG